METQSKKKVLFLITKSNWGGAQRYVYDLATSLPQDTFDIVVALGENGVLIEKLEKAGIRVIQIPGLQRDISLKKELYSFGAIAQIIKDEQPDILHVNSSKAGGIGAFCGRILRVPRIIYTAHGWAFNEDRGEVGRFVVTFLHWLTILFSHQTITVSNTLKSQMTWPGVQKKMTTVYNGRTQPEYFSRIDARSYFIDAAPHLRDYREDLWTGTIGELHPIKGHAVMLETIAKLNEKGLTIRHIIIGSGELEEKLRAYIEQNDLAEQVFLVGHHDEASQYLKAFDVYIQPSYSEALGYTVIEAAQAGLPIVASHVGGISEIITDGQNGLLVPPGDSRALQESIEHLLTTPALRDTLAQKASERGEEFSLNKMLETTQRVYQSRNN